MTSIIKKIANHIQNTRIKRASKKKQDTENEFISEGSIIGCKEFHMGTGSRINGPIIVKGNGILKIGKYCAIGGGVRVITANHEIRIASIQLALQERVLGKRFYMEKKDVIIGNDVWIGDAAIILPGVKIGDGAVIGAGAVVTKSVDPYVIAGGTPARKIGERCSRELAEKLISISWWDWNESTMERRKEFFLPWQEEKEMLDRIDKIMKD